MSYRGGLGMSTGLAGRAFDVGMRAPTVALKHKRRRLLLNVLVAERLAVGVACHKQQVQERRPNRLVLKRDGRAALGEHLAPLADGVMHKVFCCRCGVDRHGRRRKVSGSVAASGMGRGPYR